MRGVAVFVCGALLLLGDVSASDIQLFSCGFETDFCGMTHRTDDYFDWTRHSGGTVTVETGPSSAYNGTFYIYIEATDVPFNKSAEVETGSLQHSGTACVTFAYHMYGVGSGVLVVKATSASNEWRVLNDQGDHWGLGTTEVDLRPGDRVSFRAITSRDTRGDIALDDIVIRSGGCRTTEPLPFWCSFEEGFCGMLQRNDDHFDWTRFDRPTDTGLQGAADGTWFIYIETDHPRVNGNVAKIETPAIDFTGHTCVRFKYYMSGLYVGVLSVHIVNVRTERSIFRLGGDQGSEWQAAEINVTEIHIGDWLRFTGQRGLDARDIGVDDILISPGWCNGCQVNNGGCDHICTGSGTCSCRQGYTLDGTNTCVDVNECTGSANECSDDCQNTPGSYRCTCSDGKLLGVDGVSCSACPGFYGVNCSRPCYCAEQTPCDPGTGVCPGGLCSPGWSGVACDQDTGSEIPLDTIIGASAVSAAVILIVIIVVSVLMVRRRRKRKQTEPGGHIYVNNFPGVYDNDEHVSRDQVPYVDPEDGLLVATAAPLVPEEGHRHYHSEEMSQAHNKPKSGSKMVYGKVQKKKKTDVGATKSSLQQTATHSHQKIKDAAAPHASAGGDDTNQYYNLPQTKGCTVAMFLNHVKQLRKNKGFALQFKNIPTNKLYEWQDAE